MTKLVVYFRNFANAPKTNKNARSLAWLLVGDSLKRNMLSSLEHQTIVVVAIMPRPLRNPITLLFSNSTTIEMSFRGVRIDLVACDANLRVSVLILVVL
jgi:hypothetical protein